MNEKINELRINTDKAQSYFLKALAYTLGPVELKAMMEKGKVVLVDVRDRKDYAAGHLPGAISIPYDEIREETGLLDKEKIVVVYCYNQQCHLGLRACLKLAEYAYPCMHLEGGYDVWVNDFRFATITE